MPANYYSFGRVGILETGLSLQELAVQVKQKLQLSHVRVIGALQGRVHKVAMVSGPALQSRGVLQGIVIPE